MIKNGGLKLKKAVYILMLIVICTIPIFSTGCDEEAVDPALLFKTQIEPYDKRIAKLEESRGTLESRVQAVENNRATTEYVNSKFAAVTAPNMSGYYTSAQVDAAIAKAINDYKATVTTTTTGTTTAPVTGQVSYSILNPAQWNTFNTTGIIAMRITNGKSESRYVRPQLTLSTYPSGTVAVLTSGSATVTSNSQGQPPIIFGSAGVGTPITAWGTCTQIIFIPTSGGMSGGQYLLTSGSSMDIYITITLAPAYPGLWTVNVSGTDISMTTGT